MGRASVPSVEDLRPRGPLTFLEPASETTSETTGEGEATSPTSDPWAEQGPASPGGSGAPYDVESDPSEPRRTSSRASSAASSLGKRGTQEAARKAVLMAGEGAHRLLARDEVDEQLDVYRADEDDAESIGNPVGSIVHRHGWLGDAGNPDVVDGINALIGLATYGWKQFIRMREARRMRAALRAQPAEDEGTDETVEAGSEPQAWPYGGTA